MMHPPAQIPHDGMVTDDTIDESQDAQRTQSTQQASQQQSDHADGHLWGFLQPCSSALKRIDFWKISPVVTIGRNGDANSVVLPGFKVSNKHCKIVWDGKEDGTSSVVIHDFSSNGTFINGEKVGKDRTGILREGNEVAFGTALPQPQNGGLEDYRFVYRHTANGPPNSGLYAFYDIGHELGKGSFATVMKAVSRETGVWYAVKMIQDNKMKHANDNPNHNAAMSSNFAREISILETLRHPNICQLKESFMQDANIYIVLELVEGGDLLEYILTKNGLSEAGAQHITYQICDALAYIHSKGIAHRDLKPENVLLTADDPPIVKVADFGLAKFVDSLTMLRTMCGTPSYLAPEVVLQNNEEGYDHLVDSWSVGVIVFSMLTNMSPFIEDEGQRDIRTRVAERQVDWHALVSNRISDNGQDFVKRLLDTRPTHRMSLADARSHPWLKDQGFCDLPLHSRTFSSDQSYSSISSDVSMLSSVPESDDEPQNDGQSGDADMRDDLENLQIGQDAMPTMPTMPGALPNSQVNGNGVDSSRSLRRRSKVLSEAAEAEGPSRVPEPSLEMLQNISQQDGLRGRGNKRIYSELAPLEEERQQQQQADADTVPVRRSNSPRKKGKGSDDEGPRTARITRGRGKAAVVTPAQTRRRGAAENVSEEDETMVRTRRSTRHRRP